MQAALEQGYVNPESQHQQGQKSRRRLEQARDHIAKLLDCELSSVQSDSLIFTSGGTEANNLAISGLISPDSRTNRDCNIVISGIEHPSVLAMAQRLSLEGIQLRVIPTKPSGVIDVESASNLIDQQTQLVSIMLGNNETGVIQPIESLVALCNKNNIPFHTDAVQAVGKIPVSFKNLQVSALTFTAHKLHGPRGIGALLLKNGVKLYPQLFGGFQQLGSRPGTESVELAIGFEKSMELAINHLSNYPSQLQSLRDLFEKHLLEKIDGLIINGATQPRLPHTSNIAFPGVDRQAMVLALDMAGVCCSTGSACASGSSEPSPVLTAMGCSASIISSSLRFSFARDFTEAEVLDSVERISKVYNSLRS